MQVPYLQWGRVSEGVLGGERRRVRRNLMRDRHRRRRPCSVVVLYDLSQCQLVAIMVLFSTCFGSLSCSYRVLLRGVLVNARISQRRKRSLTVTRSKTAILTPWASARLSPWLHRLGK